KLGGLARTAFRAPRAAATEHQGALDLLDRLGHLYAARAGIGADEGGAAPPDTVNVAEDVQPLLGGLVPAVEDQPVRIDDRRRTEVGAVGPVHRARRGERSAKDALGGVVEPRSLSRGLDQLQDGLAVAGY